MVDSQRRLAAVLVSDVVGYSRLMGLDEAGTLRQIKAARREVVDPPLRACRGRVVKTTGDGLLVEFPSAVEAVRCAAHVQREMVARDQGVADDRRIVFRVGVHQGDIVGEGEDIFGDGVNVAARLETLCEPGGVCISGRVHEDLEGRLDLPFEDRGEQSVKNIAHPVRVFALSRAAVAALDMPQLADPGPQATSQPLRRAALGWALAVVALVAVIAAGAWAGLASFGAREGSEAAADPTKGPTIAVLAFDNLSGDPALNGFADGMSEQLIADLSVSGLYDVLARNTTFVFKGKAVDVPDIGRKLGARYVIEGSVRRVAEKLSVTAQLIDARTGAHVWAQTFEEATAATSAGEIQDKVAQWIAVAVGDLYAGAIVAREYQAIRGKSAEALSPYECVVVAQTILASAELASARACLELTVKRYPGYAQAWASLSGVLLTQRQYGGGLPPAEARDIDKRGYLVAPALEAARRAAELAPDKSFAHYALADAYYFACQPDRLRVEADRTIALDPSNVKALGRFGNWLAYMGDWDRGAQMAEKGIALSGSFAPNWWGYATAKRYYHLGDYASAYKGFLRSYSEGFWLDELHVVYTLPYLGRTDEAKAHIPVLMKENPDMSVRVADQYYRMWCFDDDYIAKMDKALRMAGLRETADAPAAMPTEAAASKP